MVQVVDEIIAEKKFTEFYEQKIKPYVAEYEALRKATLRKGLLYFFIFLALLALTIVLFLQLKLSTNYGAGDTRIVVLLLIGMSLIVLFPALKFKESVKEKIFPEIFSFFGDFKYFPEGSGSIDHYNHFNILPKCSEFVTQDLVMGKYQDVKITVEELRLEDVYLTKNGKRSTVVFKGATALFSMNKNFQGRTSIFYDCGKIRNFFQSKFSKRCEGLEPVALEDPEFEKLFEVYSDDQIEARYLLTTAFMDRLLQVPKLFKGSKIEASFYNNSLFFAISCKLDLFEPRSIFKSTNYLEECKMIISQMQLFFSIIEILKLNQRMGL